jgi:very-short-patch-repair endonuclease
LGSEAMTPTKPSAVRTPRPLSRGEEAFALHCKVENLVPQREYLFHPSRKWRFDFCFLKEKLAIEIEGVSNAFSRHTTISGYRNDLVKYNAATLLGWRVLRYTQDMVESGQAIAEVLEALGMPLEIEEVSLASGLRNEIKEEK